jgi:hypothetical protein
MIVKSRRPQWAETVAFIGDTKNYFMCTYGNEHSWKTEQIGEFRWVLCKYAMMKVDGWKCLRMASIGGFWYYQC